jgi:drug/metabolite transporter (DMT)-like permease
MSEIKGYMMILGAATLWGLSATTAKGLLDQHVDTILIVQTRVTFSCILLFSYVLLFKPRFLRVPFRDLYRFALLGMIGVAGANFTYYFTIKESTVATAILIQYTAPILVLAYEVIAKEEQLSAVKIIAAVLSLAGCFFAAGAYDVHVLKITPIGLLTGVGSVLTFAFLNVSMRHLVGRYSVWTVILYSLVFASIMWMVINPPWKIATHLPRPGVWGILAGFAAMSVLIPHTLYAGGLRFVVTSRAIITSTLEPIVAIVSAALLLGEYLQPVQMMGAVLVILAIVVLQVRRESVRPDDVRTVAAERTDAA